MTQYSPAGELSKPAYYLVVDLEATCCDRGTIPRDETEIIEIGAVMVDAGTLQPVEQFAAFVRPVRHPRLTGFCTALTSITQAQVDVAPPLSAVLAQLRQWASRFKVYLFCSWGGSPPTWSFCGIDLIDMFLSHSLLAPGVQFHARALRAFKPDQRYDLITCVHGLHYLGDKLGTIKRLASWLAPTGRLLANFDATSIRDENGRSLAAAVGKILHKAGLVYDSRKKLLSRFGSAELQIPWYYLGADAAAGANYTGQPAADSYYRII